VGWLRVLCEGKSGGGDETGATASGGAPFKRRHEKQRKGGMGVRGVTGHVEGGEGA
jgi:hypothetical protein